MFHVAVVVTQSFPASPTCSAPLSYRAGQLVDEDSRSGIHEADEVRKDKPMVWVKPKHLL